MRRANSWITIRYPATKLFIEDLEDLVSALTTERGPPTIRVGEYYFDSLKELIERENSRSIRDLVLDSDGARYTLYLTRWGLSANYYPNSDRSIKAHHDCDLILKRCRNPFWFLYQWWLMPLLATLSWMPHFVEIPLPSYAMATLFILLMIWLWGFLQQKAVFIVSRRSTWQGFVGRNRDIFVATGSALLGVVATLLAQKFSP